MHVCDPRKLMIIHKLYYFDMDCYYFNIQHRCTMYNRALYVCMYICIMCIRCSMFNTDEMFYKISNPIKINISLKWKEPFLLFFEFRIHWIQQQWKKRSVANRVYCYIGNDYIGNRQTLTIINYTNKPDYFIELRFAYSNETLHWRRTFSVRIWEYLRTRTWYSTQFSLNEEIISMNVEQAKAFTVIWANIEHWNENAMCSAHTHTHTQTSDSYSKEVVKLFAKANPNWFSIKNYYGIRTQNWLRYKYIWKIFSSECSHSRCQSEISFWIYEHRTNSKIVIIQLVWLQSNFPTRERKDFRSVFICVIFFSS